MYRPTKKGGCAGVDRAVGRVFSSGRGWQTLANAMHREMTRRSHRRRTVFFLYAPPFALFPDGILGRNGKNFPPSAPHGWHVRLGDGDRSQPPHVLANSRKHCRTTALITINGPVARFGLVFLGDA